MLINSTSELKTIVGGTPKNNDFENIAPAIEDAKNFIIPFIGMEAYDIADGIANAKFIAEVKDIELQKQFLTMAQKPIAWKAFHDYVPEGNVIFDDTGIHTQKSNEGQTAAWQWQVYDLQQLYLKKAYNTLNELLMFLDRNRQHLPFWKESDAEKQRQRLFVRTPQEFCEYFDIKGSFALFLTIVPDMLQIQRNTIRYALGQELYQIIVEKLQKIEDFSDKEKLVFEACKGVAAYYGLAQRIRTLPASLMPDGIVEYYHSDRNNIKASINARLEVLDKLYQQLVSNGDAALKNLFEVLKESDGDTPEGTFYTISSKAIGF